jgi:hypothetical protein
MRVTRGGVGGTLRELGVCETGRGDGPGPGHGGPQGGQTAVGVESAVGQSPSAKCSPTAHANGKSRRAAVDSAVEPSLPKAAPTDHVCLDDMQVDALATRQARTGYSSCRWPA